MQNELLTTRLNLDQIMDQLNQFKEDLKTENKQLKFQQENFRQQIEKGFMLNHQITETFATFYSEQQDLSPETIFIALNKQPIAPIEINEMKLEFPIINTLVLSSEERYQLLLRKMKIGQIYHVDNRKFIFKLQLSKISH